MLKINSDKVHAKVNLTKVHEFLDDLNNYKYLFPKIKSVTGSLPHRLVP